MIDRKINNKKLLLSLALLSTFSVNAAEHEIDESVIGLGAMVINMSTEYKGSNGETSLFPVAFYSDNDFSISGTEAAVFLLESGNWWLDGTASFRLQGFDEDLSEFTSGMDDRSSSFDLGMSLNYYSSEAGYLSFDVRHDASGIHKGHEFTMNYAYPLQWGRVIFTPGISIQRQSSELVNYYYGIKYKEVTIDREYYEGKSTFNYALDLDFEYELTKSWIIGASVTIIKLGNSIKNSPIVNEKNNYMISSINVVYSF
jgi:outer membrane protein